MPFALSSASICGRAPWTSTSRMPSAARVLMRIAGQSDDASKGFDDVLAGRNTEANRAIAGLLEEATADMPSEYRARVASMGQDIAAVARKQVGKPAPVSTDNAIQARKDL